MRSTILPLAFLSLPALIAAQSSYLYARYAEPEALAYADPYAYADALAYAESDADPDPYAYAEADPYAEADAYPYADPHADAHAELVTILKRWAMAYPEALAEPGPPTDPKQAACMREKTAKAHQVEDGDYAAAVKEYNGANDKTAKAAAARKCQEKARIICRLRRDATKACVKGGGSSDARHEKEISDWDAKARDWEKKAKA